MSKPDTPLFNICGKCLPLDTREDITLMKDSTSSDRCKFCTSYFTNYYNKKLGIDSLKICIACSRIKHLCQNCILDIELNIPIDLREEIFQELGIAKDFSFLTNNLKDVKSEIMKRYINESNLKKLSADKGEFDVDYKADILDKIDSKLSSPTTKTKETSGISKNIRKHDINNFDQLKKLVPLSAQPSVAPMAQLKEDRSEKYLLLFNINCQVAEWEILKSLETEYKVNNSLIIDFNCKQTGKIALLHLKSIKNTNLPELNETEKSDEADLSINIANKGNRIFLRFISEQEHKHIKTFLKSSSYQELNNMAKYIDFSMMSLLKPQTNTPAGSHSGELSKKKINPNKISKKKKRVKHTLEL